MEQHEMAGLGAALAGITHDLNNVFAIIRQANGLGLDVLQIGGVSSSNVDRLGKALARVRDQVGRGTEMISHLNRFAHRLDEPSQRIAATDILEHVKFLAGRGARLRQVRLVRAATDERLLVEAPVFRLCLALAAGVECCLKLAQTGDEIAMGAGLENDRLAFELALYRDAAPAEAPRADAELLPWQQTVASYGGRLETTACGLRLSFPA
jgi:hypothetical protein